MRRTPSFVEALECDAFVNCDVAPLNRSNEVCSKKQMHELLHLVFSLGGLEEVRLWHSALEKATVFILSLVK